MNYPIIWNQTSGDASIASIVFNSDKSHLIFGGSAELDSQGGTSFPIVSMVSLTDSIYIWGKFINRQGFITKDVLFDTTESYIFVLMVDEGQVDGFFFAKLNAGNGGLSSIYLDVHSSIMQIFTGQTVIDANELMRIPQSNPFSVISINVFDRSLSNLKLLEMESGCSSLIFGDSTDTVFAGGYINQVSLNYLMITQIDLPSASLLTQYTQVITLQPDKTYYLINHLQQYLESTIMGTAIGSTNLLPLLFFKIDQTSTTTSLFLDPSAATYQDCVNIYFDSEDLNLMYALIQLDENICFATIDLVNYEMDVKVMSSFSQIGNSVYYGLILSPMRVFYNGDAIEISDINNDYSLGYRAGYVMMNDYSLTCLNVTDSAESYILNQLSIQVSVSTFDTLNIPTPPIFTAATPLTTQNISKMSQMDFPDCICKRPYYIKWVRGYSTEYYYSGTDMMYIDFNTPEFSYAKCVGGNTTLTIVITPKYTPWPSFMVLNALNIMSVYSYTPSDIAAYSFNVTYALVNPFNNHSYISFLLQKTVYVSSLCNLSNITQNAALNLSYTVGDSPLTTMLDRYYPGNTSCPINYAVYAYSPSGVNTPYIYFNSTTLNFTLYSVDNADCNTIKVKFTGSTPDSNLTSTQYLTIKIIPQCNDIHINTFPIPYTNYDISSNSQVLLAQQNWTTGKSCCYIASYSFKLFPSNEPDSSNPPPQVNLLRANSAIKYVVKTKLIDNVGFYEKYLFVNVTDSNVTAEELMILNITDICNNTEIQKYAPFTKNITYVISNPPLNLVFDPWQETYEGYCGAFSYQAFIYPNQVLPEFISFNKNTRTFSIFNEDNSDQGVYTIQIFGTLTGLVHNYTQVNQFQLNIQCHYALIESQIQNQVYGVGLGTLIFQFPAFQITNSCPYSVIYTIHSANDEALPSYLQFFPLQRAFYVYSSDKSLEFQTYQIVLRGKVNDLSKSTYKEITFILSIVPGSANLQNTTEISLGDVTCLLGSSLQWNIPSSVITQEQLYQLYFKNVPSFTSIGMNELTFSPTSQSDIGAYKVLILLVDKLTAKVVTSYNLNLLVADNKTQENEADYEQILTSNDTFNGNVSKVKIFEVDQQITALISSIKINCTAVIKFNQKMMIPQSYKSLNTAHLSVSVLSLNDKIKVSSWQIIDFQDFSMRIQLNYSNEMQISQDKEVNSLLTSLQNADKLMVTILDNQQFISMVNQKAIPHNYTMTKVLPPQISSSSTSPYLIARFRGCNDGKHWKCTYKQHAYSLNYQLIHKGVCVKTKLILQERLNGQNVEHDKHPLIDRLHPSSELISASERHFLLREADPHYQLRRLLNWNYLDRHFWR